MNIEGLIESIKKVDDQAESFSLEDIEKKIKIEKLNSNIQDRTERKNYANKVYKLVLGFLFVILLIVIATAIIPVKFYLSDSVLITLLTTASANVIGIFTIVMKYLFKQQS
jgi:hypothetical protein